jgi:uncharacterized phiE125 gp8 family phage protein
MNPQITAKGSTPPVSLSEAKTSQRITGTGEDASHEDTLDSAIEMAENSTGRALRENTYTLRLQGFSDPEFVVNGVIRIPVFPLISITSVRYYDTDNVLQTLISDTDYEVNQYAEPGIIKPVSGKNWPSTKDKFNSVEVVFVAGYTNTGLDMPSLEIKQGIKMLFGEWNEKRENFSGRRLPTSVEVLFLRNKTIY